MSKNMSRASQARAPGVPVAGGEIAEILANMMRAYTISSALVPVR